MLNRDASGNPIYNTFDGVAVDANSILIKFTIDGDTNLDGSVDSLDENAIVAHWQQSGMLYYEGDDDYSGHVNSLDLNFVVGHWLDHL